MEIKPPADGKPLVIKAPPGGGTVLNIIQYVSDMNGDLKKPCLPVKEMTLEIEKLIRDMTLTMTVMGGLGLSAPQVGIHQQIFVMSGVLFNQEDVVVVINPEITYNEELGKNISKEYCLSYPDMGKYVERYNEVQIKAFDKEMKNQYILLGEGLQARVIQHELDHLSGITLINK